MNRVSLAMISGITACTLLLSGGDSAGAGQDVTLAPKGRLHGWAFGVDGRPMADVPITVKSPRGAVVTFTDGHGAFSVENVGAGTIEVRTPQGRHELRAWRAQSAPPASENAAFLREQRPGKRGGQGFLRRVERSHHDFAGHRSLCAPLSP